MPILNIVMYWRNKVRWLLEYRVHYILQLLLPNLSIYWFSAHGAGSKEGLKTWWAWVVMWRASPLPMKLIWYLQKSAVAPRGPKVSAKSDGSPCSPPPNWFRRPCSVLEVLGATTFFLRFAFPAPPHHHHLNILPCLCSNALSIKVHHILRFCSILQRQILKSWKL